ncbi:hypothetical protein L21SP5_03225 [Salinivirga cyanobacteriivorans]|uniref:Uncharacterized protein n=1 Tax=Salinivirga cyanobacteriivorans TaxID=1307839 RepID=A0A0S2I3N0_9BACT|nr:hypothetical protein [Salinivirga cyanobacteriivorans]ALO16839.1 hypothetical protein L21SP5_03225 [Salinivirga cyanobacteriivorans]
MKNKLLTLVILSIALAFTFISGCTEEEATTVTLDKNQTASITCHVEAQLDLMNDTANTTLEPAPAGTKVFITIQNSEYNTGAQGVTVYETEIDGSGMFTYDIPVTELGTNVTISFDEFIYDQKVIEYDGDLDMWVYGDPETKKYTAPDLVNIYVAGHSYNEKVQYGAQSF